jgi:hypothetical protein
MLDNGIDAMADVFVLTKANELPAHGFSDPKILQSVGLCHSLLHCAIPANCDRVELKTGLINRRFAPGDD